MSRPYVSPRQGGELLAHFFGAGVSDLFTNFERGLGMGDGLLAVARFVQSQARVPRVLPSRRSPISRAVSNYGLPKGWLVPGSRL